jgi:hypothetical protein
MPGSGACRMGTPAEFSRGWPLLGGVSGTPLGLLKGGLVAVADCGVRSAENGSMLNWMGGPRGPALGSVMDARCLFLSEGEVMGVGGDCAKPRRQASSRVCGSALSPYLEAMAAQKSIL